MAQRIEPDTHWFFQGIHPLAGSALIEEQAFRVASYGKQLGLITEVLLDLAQQVQPSNQAAQLALMRLEHIARDIQTLKQQNAKLKSNEIV